MDFKEFDFIYKESDEDKPYKSKELKSTIKELSTYMQKNFSANYCDAISAKDFQKVRRLCVEATTQVGKTLDKLVYFDWNINNQIVTDVMLQILTIFDSLQYVKARIEIEFGQHVVGLNPIEVIEDIKKTMKEYANTYDPSKLVADIGLSEDSKKNMAAALKEYIFIQFKKVIEIIDALKYYVNNLPIDESDIPEITDGKE